MSRIPKSKRVASSDYKDALDEIVIWMGDSCQAPRDKIREQVPPRHRQSMSTSTGNVMRT